MIIQDVYLDEYNWLVHVYYDVKPQNANYIAEDLIAIGCSEEEFYDIVSFLKNIKHNTGITYSNLDTRCSIVVISETTCAMEFQDSFDHEKGHLAIHICLEDGLDPYSEELQYLIGSIGRKLFPVAKLFLCDKCRGDH